MEIIQQIPGARIPFRKKIQDAGVVLRSVWFILLFLALGLVAFVFVEQGQDMLFAIMDDFKWSSFFLSLLALVMWAAQTAFGARLLIIFSDISFYETIPQNEGEERRRKATEVELRVLYRKKLSSLIPRILFFAPFAIMTVGYSVAFFVYQGGNWGMFLSVIGLLILTAAVSYFILYSLYEHRIAKRMDENAKRKMRSLYQSATMRDMLPLRFMLYFAVGIAVLLIGAYSFFPVSWLQELGSVHLITLSFGCWIAVLYFIAYLDKRIPFLFLKYILIAIILVISYFDDDHPVRISEDSRYESPSKTVVEYFNDWHEANFGSTSDTVPVIFVCAEGGACRSAYWTSMALAQLNDSVPGFSKHIFSFSSVSGGTLGSNVFNAIQKWKAESGSDQSCSVAVEKFYREDFLAPITGRMVFAEAFNLFSLKMIERFDRASSLEKSWESAFEGVSGTRLLENTFFQIQTGKSAPALFINSTEVETGRRAVLSNVKIDGEFFDDAVSLQEKLSCNIRYSTAILFSARFPYFSPAAAVQPHEDSVHLRRHYVDGGYFENNGCVTALEVIKAIMTRSKKNIRPIVLLLTNDEVKPVKPLRFGNEALEPPGAFMNVRTGHTNHSFTLLQKFVCSKELCGGELIHINMGLSGKVVPMNWFISENAKDSVRHLLKKGDFIKKQVELRNLLKF